MNLPRLQTFDVLLEFCLPHNESTAHLPAVRQNEQFKPGSEIVSNLQGLCANILQPLRDYIKMPIFVSSGYRCEQLNKAVGGVKNSQHLTGKAADLQAVGGMENRELFEAIKKSRTAIRPTALGIGDGENPDWVHVCFSEQNRRQILFIGR